MRKKFTRAGSALGFELVEDTPVPEQHLIQPNSGNRSWPPRPK